MEIGAEVGKRRRGREKPQKKEMHRQNEINTRENKSACETQSD